MYYKSVHQQFIKTIQSSGVGGYKDALCSIDFCKLSFPEGGKDRIACRLDLPGKALQHNDHRSRYIMAPVITHKSQQGFALLIAVIFMSVMLGFALTIGALGYKQSVLAGAAVNSQYAFYAADAALECALYNDYKISPNPFKTTNSPFVCGDAARVTSVSDILVSGKAYKLAKIQQVSLDGGTRCADITVYKPAGFFGTTWLFAQGYNVKCADVVGSTRFATRALNTQH
jgi:hypothetical protein